MKNELPKSRRIFESIPIDKWMDSTEIANEVMPKHNDISFESVRSTVSDLAETGSIKVSRANWPYQYYRSSDHRYNGVGVGKVKHRQQKATPPASDYEDDHELAAALDGTVQLTDEERSESVAPKNTKSLGDLLAALYELEVTECTLTNSYGEKFYVAFYKK